MNRFCMLEGKAKSIEGIEGSHDVDHQDMAVNSRLCNELEAQLSLHTKPTPHGRKADAEEARNEARKRMVIMRFQTQLIQ